MLSHCLVARCVATFSSEQVSYWCAPWLADGLSAWVLGRFRLSSWLLVSTCPSPSCCRSLGSKPVDRRLISISCFCSLKSFFFFFWRLKKVIEYSLIFTLKNYSFLKIYQTGRSLPSAGSYRCMPPEVWANPGQSQKLGLTQSVCLWVAGCNTWAIPCCLPGYTPARELKLEGNWHSEGSCWYCSVRNQCPKQLI